MTDQPLKMTYFHAKNNNSIFNPNTGLWKIELPYEFTMSNNPNKSITLLNFMYYARWTPDTADPINLSETTLHSPTLCDGNWNQDYYITTITYEYNTVMKSYPIKTKPQYLEFFFKNYDGTIVKKFVYQPGESGDDNRGMEERFLIELELFY